MLCTSGPGPCAQFTSLATRVEHLERLASIDHLTGAWNRGHFERLLPAEISRMEGSRQPISLLLLDIDHFKAVNDRHGHAAGDVVLKELARRVQARLRPTDALFRWGGEEFAVLVSTGRRSALRLAEDIRAAIEAGPFPGVGTATVSIGVAEHVAGQQAEAWFARLDAALYAAKRAGRNRVVADREGDSNAWEHAAVDLALRWHESYECGDDTIDREHRELFDRANALFVASLDVERPAARLAAELDPLVDHVASHFAHEERILADLGYAGLPAHRRTHRGLLHRAQVLRERLDGGEDGLPGLVDFLIRDVVARHMLRVDRAFFPLIQSMA